MFEDVQPGNEIIPEKDFREAIKACRKDPELDRYFKFAPQAARRFIGLGFYSTHFGERADKERYEAYLAKVEPTLKEADLKYLIRFEPDKDIRAHLKDLLAHPPPPPPPAEKARPPSPAKPDKPSSMAQAAKRLSAAKDEETEPDSPTTQVAGLVRNVGLAIAVTVCVISICFNIKQSRDLQEERAKLQSANDDWQALKTRLDKAQAEASQLAERLARQAKEAARVTDPTPASREPERAAEVLAPVENDAATKSEETEPAPAEPAPGIVNTPKKGPRVRLTDGTRIVRHPDGSIDVPREFSYAGAGLRKPFWQYDQVLEKSGKAEAEAQRERQAIEEWKALHDEAFRQAGGNG